MAINFPNSPTLNQTYTDPDSGFSFQWNGTVWASYTINSLVLNVVARTETVAVPISVGSNVITDNSYAAYAGVAGVSTYSTYAATAGVSTYSTYAETAGISTTSSSSTGTSQINDLDLALFD